MSRLLFQTSAAADYTATVTLLALAFVFNPVIFYWKQSHSSDGLVVMIAISGACVALAALSWRNAQPSLAVPATRLRSTK